MRIAYIECFSGVSGDMLLGALIGAGVSEEKLREAAEALGVEASLRVRSVMRGGIAALKVDVLCNGELAEQAAGTRPDEDHPNEHHPNEHHPNEHHHEHPHTHGDSGPLADGHSHEHRHSHLPHRGLREILALIDAAAIRPDAKRLASAAFRLLAAAESRIHGVPEEQVHFHEAGAVDSIVDIVCCAVGFCELGVEEWEASPVNVGSGSIDCAHGSFPVPAPATAELLRDVPTYSSGAAMELATPTGAALLRALGCSFGQRPAMRASQIGYGAGTRNPEKFPNVLRISVGESEGSFGEDRVLVMECAIDDQSPQVLAHFMEAAFSLGALDVTAAPVAMKKGRLGTLLTLLVRPGQQQEFAELVFRETSTLGIRFREERRMVLDREFVTVETEFGSVRMKTGSSQGVSYNSAPEFEDCKRLAEEHEVSVKCVMQAALAAFAEHRRERAKA